MLFLFLIALIATAITVGDARASGHCASMGWLSAEKKGNTFGYVTLARASQRTGLSFPLLYALVEHESRWGRNVGRVGAGISDAHPVRDGALFWLLAEKFGRDPKRACASRRPGFGWGGAIGIMQVLPSTFAYHNGWVVTRSKTQFSAKMGRNNRLIRTPQDTRILQWFLNKRGYRVAEDGKMGPETRNALVRMQKKAGFKGTFCQKEIGTLGGCTRSYIAVKAGLIKIKYDRRRDKVRKAFNLSGKLDPWSFKGGIYTGSYYLLTLYHKGAKKGYGFRKGTKYMLGAYYAGPGGAFNRDGRGYAADIIGRAKIKRNMILKEIGYWQKLASKKKVKPVYSFKL